MNCKYCGEALPAETHGKREYCSGAHKQAYYRRQHQQDQAQGRTFTEMLSELADLREKVVDQAHTIDDQVQEITQLRQRLDVDRRYLEDTTPRTFKAWLRKQPSSPWRDRILSDQLVPARGSRSLYEAHVRRLCTDEEERDDFVRLWKLMLLQS